MAEEFDVDVSASDLIALIRADQARRSPTLWVSASRTIERTDVNLEAAGVAPDDEVAEETTRGTLEVRKEPLAEEISGRSGIPLDQVERALTLVREPKPLDAPVSEDGDATLGDFLEAVDAVSPHAAAEASALRALVLTALDELTPREQRIVRFGMDGASEQTLKEIGEAFGVTRERIRQIEAKAFAKLRESTKARDLLTFLED